MKFCNMAVVVPVDQLTGSKAALSAQVWGQVSNLLMPALGKLYRQFHPANDAWGHILMQVQQKFLFVQCIRRIRNVQTSFLKRIVTLEK